MSVSEKLTPPKSLTHLTTTYLTPLFLTLLPSPIATRLRKTPSSSPSTKPPKVHPTSYLDGLRGLASFFVFTCHVTSIFTPQYMEYYNFNFNSSPNNDGEDGGGDGGVRSNPIQLPFIRVIFTGNAWVHVFFVISGFALSLKPVRLARRGCWGELLKTLSSMIARRALRLFLPAFAALLISHIILGADRSERSGIPAELSARVSLWFTRCRQLVEWSWQWDQRWQGAPLATWTLPIEMCMSLLLAVVLAGLAPCRGAVRMGVGVALVGWCFFVGKWAGGEFLGGMCLVEGGYWWEGMRRQRLGRVGAEEEDGVGEVVDGEIVEMLMMKKRRTSWRRIVWVVFCWCQFLCALWICGWPDHNVDKAPGLRWLYFWTPNPYFQWGGDSVARPWFGLAALQIVFACQQLRLLQRLLTLSVVQYLGKVSFALYLTHPIGIAAYGLKIMPYVSGFFSYGEEGQLGFWGLFAVWVSGLLILGSPALWIADVFTRYVDTPTVKLARWLDTKSKTLSWKAEGGGSGDIELQTGPRARHSGTQRRDWDLRDDRNDQVEDGLLRPDAQMLLGPHEESTTLEKRDIVEQ